MSRDDEFFTPEDIDEQIDSLARGNSRVSETAQPAERLVSHLRHTYQHNPQQQPDPLNRAWKRIVASHQAVQQTSQREGKLIYMDNYQTGQQNSHTPRKKRTFIQRFGVLAAVLFIGLLIGGMALALNIGHSNRSQTGSGGTPFPRPAHPITGGKCTIDTTHPHAQQSLRNLPGLYLFALNQQSDNLLYRYDPQTKKVVWSIKLCNSFQSSGTIAQNGILYLAGTDWTHEVSGQAVSYLYALNESDGSAIWGIQFPTMAKTFGPVATPSNHSTGTPSPNAGSSPVDLGMIEAPTLANGILYVVQRSGIVYAYNATTGERLWTFNSGRDAWATTKYGNGAILDPSSVQVVNGVAYFSIVDRVYALNAQSGQELWGHNFNNALNINQNPAIDNGTVYLTTFVPGYGYNSAPDTYLYAFDAQTGTQKWVTKKLAGYVNGPVAFNSQLHAMSYDGIWYTFNPSTGAVEAQKTLRGAAGVISPELINGVLYSMSNSGVLSVLNPDGSAQWSAQAQGQYPFIQDVQGGVIYVIARGSGVYAYSATNGKLLWHYEGYRPQPESNLMVTVVA